MKSIGVILILVCLFGGMLRGQTPSPVEHRTAMPPVALRSDFPVWYGVPDNQLIVSYNPSLSQSANDRSILTFATRNNLGPYVFRLNTPSTYLLVVPEFVPLSSLGQALQNDPAVLSVRRGHVCFNA